MNIQPTHEKVDHLFSKYTDSGSPGCAVGVFKDGEMLYEQGYGLTNIEHQVPFLRSSVVNIGSTSKQFTVFGIALLENKVQLSLGDDIHEHLPEMKNFGSMIAINNFSLPHKRCSLHFS